MNYKEMLDKFEFLEKKLNYLENENKHLKERVAKLEFGLMVKNTPSGPGFTPGTIPAPVFGPEIPNPWPNNPNHIWCSTEYSTVSTSQYGDH